MSRRTLEYARRQEREGKAIRKDRVAANLSATAVAYRAGVGLTTLHNVEHGGGSDAVRDKIRTAIVALVVDRPAR